MPPRSTSVDGVARRIFIAGMRLCPPASGRVPSSPRSESASSTLDGRW
jgi:hypothetical protein